MGVFEAQVLFATITSLIVLAVRRALKHARPLTPPGPGGLPLVGNLFDFPTSDPCLAASKWRKEYGDITYLNIMGMGIVYLHTAEVAKELLVKRGAVYSDRPPLIMATELCGYEPGALRSYGDRLRRQRALMERALGMMTIPTYHPLLEVETGNLLHQLVSSPGDYCQHITRYAGALSLLVVYGHRVTANDDEMLVLAKDCLELLCNEVMAAPPKGIWAVDVFPFLKNIPDWIPFASFKRKAAKWRIQISDFYNRPFAEVKRKMAESIATPSFCSILLQDEHGSMSAQKEYDIKWAANTILTGSIDTISTVIQHLLLLMVLYPDSFAKAREELDIVVKDRMPTFADRPSLPNSECVLSEILRLSCPIPLGLPHCLREDDVYNKYFIPKGTVVIANILAMTRDEELFPDPEIFNPERYGLTIDEATRKARDPRQWIFGFGRRRCPGIHLMESSVWLAMVAIIATLNVTKAVNANGKVVEPEVKFENMVFRIPNKFQCEIKPRSEQHAALISNTRLNLVP
ncbi:cytochrome P450 [Obba rivulosa]|uniref:Cytochrome P450 n=1 Tax=Obba rivulosa TaxID=1052685 RepID=A0A8E2DIF3_9APHY|nr:cytochrome P450 [Obba rivulosa]